MSTPAAAALSGAGAAPGAGAGGAPGGAAPVPGGQGGGGAGPAGGGAGAGAGGAANQPFFNDWFKPDAPDAKDTTAWLTNKNFADPATLVKSYRGLETEAASLRAAASLKGYPAATKNADGTVKAPDAAVLKAWDTAMGVPETADKYDFGDLSKSPGVDPGFVKLLGEELHGVHTPAALATAQAAAYERAVARHVENLVKAENEQSEAARKQVEQEWGSNYQERAALGKRGMDFMAKEVGGLNEEQWRTIERALGTGKFMNMMWKFGAGNREASFPGNDGGGGGQFQGGAAAAQAEYDTLMADRASGKINDAQWRATGSKRERELADIIAGGFAPNA